MNLNKNVSIIESIRAVLKEFQMSKGQNIAYIRVSTQEQNTQRQIESLKAFSIDRFFEEKISAKNADRPKLKEMLDFVRQDDIIYVCDFSRLARSTKDLLNIVESLDNKGVNLVSVKENLNSKTPQGKLMLTMLGAIYEFERANILERQKEGIEIAKKKGKYKGRKPVKLPQDWEFVYRQWQKREISSKEAKKILNLKNNTFHKFVREQKEKETSING